MNRPPPGSSRTDTLFPYTTLFRSMLTGAKIAGAGLDVFEHEPAVNPKLLGLKNVLLLPHMGSATIEGRVDMGEKVIINIKTFVDGHRSEEQTSELQSLMSI